MSTKCRDCGTEYYALGCDLVLPDQQWNALCPEDGVLCANCICKRARKCSGTVLLAWIADFDYACADALTTLTKLAPLAGYVHGCQYCPLARCQLCAELVVQIGRILCEAPDAGQIQRRQHNLGIDLRQVASELNTLPATSGEQHR